MDAYILTILFEDYIDNRAVDPHPKHADPDPGLDEHADLDPDPGNNNWLTQNLKNISKLDY